MERATWVWSGEGAGVDAWARRAAERQVTEVFVGVPWHGPTPETTALVAAFRRRGIRCTSLGGDAGWARDPALAAQWAARARGGFDGVHFDVEPWTLDEWSADAERLLAGIAIIVEAAAEASPVEIDLPGWLAREHPDAFRRIALAADAVTILAYRDRAPAILAEAGAARALAGRYRIAVDTVPSATPGSTFHGEPAEVLRRETDAVAAAAATDPRFLGVAVHDLAGWCALR